MSDSNSFYDALASTYDNHVGDWEGATFRHGHILAGILSMHGIVPGSRLVDAACGIGTQTIGLARAGYSVTGVDASPLAVQRARDELAERGLRADILLGNMLTLDATVGKSFADAIICCDNSLPHLTDESQLRTAFEAMRDSLNATGMIILSVRDYDRHLQTRPTTTQPLRRTNPVPTITFQTWDWLNDEAYTSLLFRLSQAEDGTWATHTYPAVTFRAWSRREITWALAGSGFIGVQWRAPASTGFHQWIATATRGGAT